jgi:hypothetical protein
MVGDPLFDAYGKSTVEHQKITAYPCGQMAWVSGYSCGEPSEIRTPDTLIKSLKEECCHGVAYVG